MKTYFSFNFKILATLIFQTSFCYASDFDYKASLYSKNYKQDMKLIKSMDIDVAGVDYEEKIIDLLLYEKDRERLESRGLKVELNWIKGVSIDLAVDQEYKTSYEVERFVQTANGLFPELTHLVEIGKSLEGRQIWALKISDNADKRELDEPVILFNSMHHAREVMTPEVSLDIIEYLLSNYENDERVKAWVDNNEIWVVPMLNVDGNNKVWTEKALWRKNTRDGHGVDLNRNYPYGWNSCRGSSGNKNADDYRGPEPASEPETRALMGLVEEIKPVFDISYHSYSNLVLYPYGCRNSTGANPEAMISIGKEMGKLLGYKAGTPPELLYQADGGDIDWMLAEHQVIPYVIELNSRSDGFQPDYKKTRDKTVELNRRAWMLLLDKLSSSGVRGVVTNKNPNQVVKIYKASKLIQTYKVNPDGSFHIVLKPGVYELEIESLKSTSLKNKIKVNEGLIDLGNI